MRHIPAQDIAEVVGIFLVVLGCLGLVVAAALISVALAAATAAVLVIFAGVLTIYVANAVAKRKSLELVQQGR